MEEFVWLCALAGFITFMMRWLLLRGLSPVNQQVIRQMFVEQLRASASACQLVEDDGAELTVRCGQIRCTIYFEALYRRCMAAPHRTMLFIRQAVQAVIAALADDDLLPADWRDRVMPLLLNDAIPLPHNLLLQPLAAELQIGYVFDAGGSLRWLTEEDLARMDSDRDTVHALALRNLERSCHSLVIEAPPPLADGRDRLLRFRTRDGFDATRVLLPSFYQRFAPRFGDADLLVAIPTRDELIVVPATDQAQASFLQWRLDAERQRSPRPLADTLLHLTAESISVWTPAKVAAEDPA